jgi:hypothetical protein
MVTSLRLQARLGRGRQRLWGRPVIELRCSGLRCGQAAVNDGLLQVFGCSSWRSVCRFRAVKPLARIARDSRVRCMDQCRE